MDLIQLEMTTKSIDQENIMKQIKNKIQYGLGSVESILVNPILESQILIGYRKGCIILWNIDHECLICNFEFSQELESLFWHPSGKMFLSCHSEGTIIHWSLFQEHQNLNKKINNQYSKSHVIPYGPSNCRAIGNIYWYGSLFIFSNGTPYNDEINTYAITLMAGGTFLHVYLFSSPILKFDVILNNDNNINKNFDGHWNVYPSHLIVLTEQELTIVKLSQKLHKSKYKIKNNFNSSILCNNLFTHHFPCLQYSNISCIKIIENTCDNFINILMNHGKTYGNYEEHSWPITGGHSKLSHVQRNDLLITGYFYCFKKYILISHENGDVIFWWTRPQTTFKLLTKFSTCKYFQENGNNNICNNSFSNQNTNFEKSNVGFFQLYSDDVCFHIRKIEVSTQNGILYIGGNAGNVMIINLEKYKYQNGIVKVFLLIIFNF